MSALKRFVIVGVSGTGKAVATRLVQQGHHVQLVGRNTEKLASLAQSLGAKAEYTVVDVTQAEAFERTMQDLGNKGPVNGLVYAVGSIPLKPFKSTTAKDFLECYTLNFLGGALALKALAAPLAAAAGGAGAGAGTSTSSAVFYSTIAASVGFPNHTAIAAAKGAVESFVRSAAAEMSPKVRINCIAPSLTDTPLAGRLLSSETMRKALGEAHPLSRVGTVDDLASMTCFLLDDAQSGWVTGQTFHVDGGRSTVRPKN
jgi:NAD(P)-dependent dehydrogenase (short-subunit alcohol dehydrogenase family)